MTMNRLISAGLLVTLLNGCAGIPLISTLEASLTVNGAIASVTRNYERQAVSAVVNFASHKSTGKTVSEHLYAAVETKYTKKRLEKHFKNRKLTVTDFEIVDNKSIGDYLPSKKSFAFLTKHIKKASFFSNGINPTKFEVSQKVKWQGFNYRVYDAFQPNFDIN